MNKLNANFSYVGGELDVFANANNWRKYWQSKVTPFLGTCVLEVGAGIGSTTVSLSGSSSVKKWLAVEPDVILYERLTTRIKADAYLLSSCVARLGGLESVEYQEKFDSILYIDVLEHIENDYDEIAAASKHLKDGGYLIVLAPAHSFLFSDFDRAVGHYRRYTISSVLSLTQKQLKVEKAYYLDSVGLLASATNRFLLHSSTPTIKQIKLWDNWMVPFSKLIDPVLNYRIGKTVLIVWKKIDNNASTSS